MSLLWSYKKLPQLGSVCTAAGIFWSNEHYNSSPNPVATLWQLGTANILLVAATRDGPARRRSKAAGNSVHPLIMNVLSHSECTTTVAAVACTLPLLLEPPKASTTNQPALLHALTCWEPQKLPLPTNQPCCMRSPAGTSRSFHHQPTGHAACFLLLQPPEASTTNQPGRT